MLNSIKSKFGANKSKGSQKGLGMSDHTGVIDPSKTRHRHPHVEHDHKGSHRVSQEGSQEDSVVSRRRIIRDYSNFHMGEDDVEQKPKHAFSQDVSRLVHSLTDHLHSSKKNNDSNKVFISDIDDNDCESSELSSMRSTPMRVQPRETELLLNNRDSTDLIAHSTVDVGKGMDKGNEQKVQLEEGFRIDSRVRATDSRVGASRSILHKIKDSTMEVNLQSFDDADVETLIENTELCIERVTPSVVGQTRTSDELETSVSKVLETSVSKVGVDAERAVGTEESNSRAKAVRTNSPTKKGI